MKLKLSDLWLWEGEFDRGGFAFWGAMLFAVKFIHRIHLRVLNHVKNLSEQELVENPGARVTR